MDPNLHLIAHDRRVVELEREHALHGRDRHQAIQERRDRERGDRGRGERLPLDARLQAPAPAPRRRLVGSLLARLRLA